MSFSNIINFFKELILPISAVGCIINVYQFIILYLKFLELEVEKKFLLTSLNLLIVENNLLKIKIVEVTTLLRNDKIMIFVGCAIVLGVVITSFYFKFSVPPPDLPSERCFFIERDSMCSQAFDVFRDIQVQEGARGRVLVLYPEVANYTETLYLQLAVDGRDIMYYLVHNYDGCCIDLVETFIEQGVHGALSSTDYFRGGFYQAVFVKSNFLNNLSFRLD